MRGRNTIVFIRKRYKLGYFVQIKIPQQGLIILAMIGDGQNLIVIFADVMRHDNMSVLVENRNGLSAIVANNIVDLRASFRELCAKVGNSRR